MYCIMYETSATAGSFPGGLETWSSFKELSLTSHAAPCNKASAKEKC